MVNIFFINHFLQELASNDFSAGFRTQFNNRLLNIRLSGVFVADDYKSDLGFVRRTDIFKINPQIELKFWPKNKKIQRHSFTVIPISIWRPELDFENSDYTIISRWEANFLNSF